MSNTIAKSLVAAVFVLCLVLLPLLVISLGGYVHLKKRRS